METISALLALCAGNSPVTSEFPSQRPVTRSFDVSFDLRWVNNREAGDMRCHWAHYDVIVMCCGLFLGLRLPIPIHSLWQEPTNCCKWNRNNYCSMKNAWKHVWKHEINRTPPPPPPPTHTHTHTHTHYQPAHQLSFKKNKPKRGPSNRKRIIHPR